MGIRGGCREAGSGWSPRAGIRENQGDFQIMSPWVRLRHQPVITEQVLEVLGAGSKEVCDSQGRGWVSREDPWEAQGREHLSNVNDDLAIMEHYINVTSYLKDLPDLTCRLQGIQLQLGCAQDPVSLEQAPMYVRGHRMVGPG